ncbi:MAG: hypothetical protein ACI8XO_004815, partial [Verrucomicrobiales bacterium]
WLRLLRENRVSPAYWHRALFVSVAAAMNSLYARREARHDEAVRATELAGPPLFILGHWRSGTTHLHNMLAKDTQNFAFANTYQVTNPSTFLSSEEKNSRRFAKLVPDKRPMDNVAMGFAQPQEEEFAPCLMTLKSPYLGISFPRRMVKFERYLSFDGVPVSEIDEWKRALLWFCKKLTLKYRRPLVLKSPPHTARIRLLLELFPDARFVHIHRHPHDVFRSTRHYWDTAVWYTYLQKPDRSQVDDEIIARYRALHDAFHEQRSLIPEGRFHELSFDALEADPVSSVREIYSKLSLPGFADYQPELERYLTSLGSYKKNQFKPLGRAVVERLADAWRPEFDRWNYDPHRK